MLGLVAIRGAADGATEFDGFEGVGAVEFHEAFDEVGPLLSVLLGELKKHGLETLDLESQPFDPEVAEAVAHEPGEGGDVLVAEVLRSGYRWKGRTLRPAMVRTKD